MRLQFCDQCGRPLSEGAIARGEAVEHEGETICAQCMARRPASAAEYQQAVWHCEGCGIPVTALDLIEGRASPTGGTLRCSRCVSAGATAAKAVTKAPSLPRAAPIPVVRTQPARQPSAAAEHFVHAASREQRRPVLPLVLIAIVLPMFAVSLWFAVTSQQRLNEVMAAQGNEARHRPPPEQANAARDSAPGRAFDGDHAPPTKVEAPDPTQPLPPRNEVPVPLPEDVANDLVAIEKELAEPVIHMLQSDKLGEVREGLIESGARRLIATRPYVRRLLGDPDDGTRVLACRVAAMLDDKEALPQLSRMAEQDPDDAVQTEARKARDRLTGQGTREVRDMTPQEIEKLIKDLQDELERRKGSND